MRPSPRRIPLFASLLLTPFAGTAFASEMLISEVVEGSSNNKAVEIHNASGAAIDLAADGYTLQFFSNGGTSASFTLALSGTVADGDAFVIAPTNANATILAAADQTSGTAWFNGDDAIVLRRGGSTGAILDVVGQIGFDPGTQWGSDLVSTADNTIRRKAGICAGDSDGSDAFDPSGQWDGFATDTFDGLGSHASGCTGSVEPTAPSATGLASPATLSPGESTLLTVAVTAGTLPASTDITVVADLAGIGGSATQAFHDDGTHGDDTPGDGLHSYLATVAADTAPGMRTLPVTVSDAQDREGATSIALSVVARVGIAAIQGRGVGSPLATGTAVITEGIVTARRSNGYFIQSAPGAEDGDPTTAEGLFVFTNAAPPADAQVGNLVRVAGRVSAFSRTPHGYPLTQLGNSSVQAVLATGQPLPARKILDASVLSPGVASDALGRYQGMRVTLAGADVVGPTNGFGDFHVVPARTPRPAREPGVAVLDAVPLPEDKAIPRFDRNPERLRVESTGLAGGTPLHFDAGTRLPRLDGVMYYDRGDFTLLYEGMGRQRPLVGGTVAAVPFAQAGSIRIASYNIENLSGGASVPLGRLAKLTEVFCQYLDTPDIVGLVEIANLATAQRLAQAINEDEFDTCPDNPMYEAHLLSTSGSQRLGYLVRTSPAPSPATDGPRVEVLSVQERFVTDTLTAPDGSANGLLFDRPPLHLRARVHGENGNAYDLDVVLNHTLSLLDVNDPATRAVWGTNGARSRGKRLQQAVRLSELVESIQAADATAPLVLIGDYNAFEFSDGYVDVLGIISGDPAAENTVLDWAPSAVTRPLFNLIETKPVAQRYSYVFEGNTQVLDHALVNAAVLETAEVSLYHARVNADFAADNAADPTVPLRTSDHDPLVAELLVPTFLDADLAVDVTARTATAPAGSEPMFTVRVDNLGPQRALATELTLFAAAAPADVRVMRHPGWECSTPMADPAGARVFCAREQALAPGGTDRLTMRVRTSAPPSLLVRATADTRSVDVNAANDADSATVRVTPPAK